MLNDKVYNHKQVLYYMILHQKLSDLVPWMGCSHIPFYIALWIPTLVVLNIITVLKCPRSFQSVGAIPVRGIEDRHNFAIPYCLFLNCSYFTLFSHNPWTESYKPLWKGVLDMLHNIHLCERDRNGVLDMLHTYKSLWKGQKGGPGYAPQI